MKQLLLLVFYFCCLSFISIGQKSNYTVKYKITYDSTIQTYTAWVVPDYAVPNVNNTGNSELGATAQFTVVVPKDFEITSLNDIHGIWDKPTSPTFIKLGVGLPNQSWVGLDPTFNYYVIGKAPSETDYGSFLQGVPVALFSFKGNGCYGSIKALPANDAFITLADNQMQLNVSCSFYSRSGQPLGGNQNPLEQFIGLAASSVNCSKPVIATSQDTGSGSTDKPIVVNVLDNDKKNGTVVNPDSVTVGIIAPPKHGVVSIDSTGKLTYIPDPGFTGKDSTEYEVCSGPVCSSGVVYLDVQASASDLSISKTVNKTLAVEGDNLIYTITVKNKGIGGNANIIVSDTLASSLQYVSSSATKGFYDIVTKHWTIPVLSAGDSAVLSIVTKVLTQGVTQNYASIVFSQLEDSTLTNNEATACTSVPMNMCSDEQLNVSIPDTYTNVQWYKDGVPFATGNSIVIAASGNYTYTASNALCPVSGCCPIIVIVNDCCKQGICVPYTIIKTRVRK